MSRQYSTLTTKFAKWLFPLIDRVDAGFHDHHTGAFASFYTNEQLESWSVGRYPPRPITKTHLAGHLAGYETICYRSLRKSGYLLFCIDIDSKHGETDAKQVAHWISERYLPGIYHEPSTHGRGVHMYGVLHVGLKTRQFVNKFFQSLSFCLNALAHDAGFQASVDQVCGTFTIYGKAKPRRMKERGRMATLPRLPKGLDSLNRLISAPVYLPAAFQAIVADYKALRLESHNGSKVNEMCIPRHEIHNSENETEVELDDPVSDQRKPNSIHPSSFELNEVIHQDAWHRAEYAVLRLARELRRVPTLDEALRYYDAMGLNNRKHVHPDRLKRFRKAIRRCAKSFDVDLCSGRMFDVDQYHDLLAQHIRPWNRDDLCYKKSITSEDLAITLYTIEIASFKVHPSRDRQFSCPSSSIQGMFLSLREKGVTGRGCNRNKAVSIKRILIDAGLAQVLDAKYRPGGAWLGIGKKIVVGPTHPRHKEWKVFRDRLLGEEAK